MPGCSQDGADKDPEQKTYPSVSNQSHQLQINVTIKYRGGLNGLICQRACYKVYRKNVLHSSNHVFSVSIVTFVHYFHQLHETPVAASVKVSPSEEGPSKTASSPKESLSPGTEADTTSGEMSSSSWVVDGSGFLSPAGPALKEVLDMVDGVCIPNNQQTACSLNMCPILAAALKPLCKMSHLL